jgi:hypothetical protein
MRTLLKLAVAPAAALVLLASSHAAVAADAAKEISMAAAHAGMAAGSADMKMVQMHLHHVMNCLSGPGGMGYDAAQGNPCKDLGMGAIPDSAMDKRMGLEAALKMASDGAMEMDMTKAKEKAAATQAALSKLAM